MLTQLSIVTPGVGYLEALCEDNVDVVTTGIERIVPEGIQTKDGKVHPCDVLICATGFDVSTRPHFDVVGRDGYIFTDDFAKAPKGYMTVTMSNMPNYFSTFFFRSFSDAQAQENS